jgi:hypothetical protein
VKKYRVLGILVLGFEEGREQVDAYVESGDVLECDGSTVWAIWRDGKRAESITTPNIIAIALERGDLEEITDAVTSDICPDCDSGGTDVNGHLCKTCQGKGYR